MLVKKGSTNVSVELYIVDSGDGTPELSVAYNTSGIDLNYRRDGAAVTSITEADLASLTTAHTDGGFKAIANGRYRLDVPDAAFASGVDKVTIGGTVTGMVVYPLTIQLVDFDPQDATRLGLTALPNAAADAAGGLPISDTGGLDLDAIKAKTDNLPSDPADQSLIIAATDAITAAIAALNDVSATDILTTQMTESYAADGVAPTLTQALFLIQQALTEFAYSGTTNTVKRLDGSTTAATFTLDDATDPTSQTRAT